MTDLQMGIYRHYKGNLYQVLGLGHDANADSLASSDALEHMPGEWPGVLGERIVVVYIGLQLDGAHFGPRLAVRTLDDFMAWVDVPGVNEAWHHVTDSVPRFEYLGPVLTPDMLS